MNRAQRWLVSAGLSSAAFVVVGIANAASYTVKAGGGGNFTTIQACANAAVAGDTCTVFAGSYAGWKQTASGTAGHPITFTVNPGDTVNITSGVTVTNTNYVTIGAPDAGGGCGNNGRMTGAGGANPSFTVGGCFVFVNSGVTGPSCGSGAHTNHFHLTHNTSRGSRPASFVSFEQGSVATTPCMPYVDTNSDDNYVAHNDLNWNIDKPAAPFCENQILIYGMRNLFEYNDMQGTGAQHVREGGSFNVVRYNYAHDDDGNKTLGCGQSPAHIDFFFSEGNDAPSLSYSLTERNAWKNCANDQGNCKFSFSRANGADANNVSDTVLSRYNYVYKIDGSEGGAGDQNDGANTTPNWHTYNNTFATENFNSSSGACGTFASGIGVELNTICYNSQGNQWTPLVFLTHGSFSNGNLAYDTTCTTNCTWSFGTSDYVNEPTFPQLHNKNPMFGNYPTDGTLQSGSPALGAGVNLTTVSSGCGTSSLVVKDARFFQPGWGPSDMPIPGDTIRVGASTAVKITGINYSTNTLTFASPVQCSAGDPVNLYEDTLGTVLLTGTVPNVGAFGTAGQAGPPAPPTNLTAVVH